MLPIINYDDLENYKKKAPTSGKSHPGRWPHQLVLISAPRVVETTSIRDGICVNLVRNYHYRNKGGDPKGLGKLHPHPSVFVGKVKERSRVGQQFSGVVGLASAREVHRGGGQRCGSFTWMFEMSHSPSLHLKFQVLELDLWVPQFKCVVSKY